MADIRKRTGSKGTTYQVRYASKSTKTGYAYASFRTLKEARTFNENLGGLQHATGGKVTVSEAVQKWLDICEKVGRDGREVIEYTTLLGYEHRAVAMKAYSWDKYLHELTPTDLIKFRTWLIENYSRDYARRTLSSFHSVLIEMKHQGLITHDPAAGITVRNDGRYEEDSREVQIPTDDEMRALLVAADKMGDASEYYAKVWRRYRPLIYLAVFTGMRPSEYRGLAWSNVFPDRIKVRQRADLFNTVGPVKSKAGRRDLFIPKAVFEMLQEWKKKCPASPLGLVFPTSTGKPMALNNLTRRCWEPLLEAAKLMDPDPDSKDGAMRPRYTPYALRHYFASKLIEKGTDLKFIQTAMGHADIQLTLNTYGHLIRGKDDAHKERAEAFAAELMAAE
ncbi:site-specific integrase [Rhizobium sp. T1470]|uniref:tyrosine-type recombinase/integrase n=1 Tax=unclassified Rhizobium TaxID=2613769 RepID=UPI001AAFDDB7|nr:site-specific integrase [Rhizobium sp. T1473]MCA0800428.1 site-specific integrase [Rhizobium sp. T1473]